MDLNDSNLKKSNQTYKKENIYKRVNKIRFYANLLFKNCNLRYIKTLNEITGAVIIKRTKT